MHVNMDHSNHSSNRAHIQNQSSSTPLLVHRPDSRPEPSIFDKHGKFRGSLKWCALDHSSFTGQAVSFLAFLLLAILVPTISTLSVKVPHNASSGIAIDKLAQLPESALAAIAFFALSSILSKHGIRHLLFLDGLLEDSHYVQHGYARELDRAFKYLAYILLPSFAVELAHKIVFFSTVSVQFPVVGGRLPGNSIMFLAGLASWVYRTGVFLFMCILFRLTCELQILRLEGFKQGLEIEYGSDVWTIFSEHMRIKNQLLVTSHRYRVFILGCLVTITVSQLGALLLIFSSKSHTNFFNSGDLIVCSAVQLSGFCLCLMGAARITHRAQGVVAIATRWHMLMTCTSGDAAPETRSAKLNSNLPQQTGETRASNADRVPQHSPTLHTSSSYETRQVLVNYLQHNNGGITLFGFTLDRGLLYTLFAFEMSLVLWILSKVIEIS